MPPLIRSSLSTGRYSPGHCRSAVSAKLIRSGGICSSSAIITSLLNPSIKGLSSKTPSFPRFSQHRWGSDLESCITRRRGPNAGMEGTRSGAGLINCGAIPGFGDGFLFGARSSQPGSLCDFCLLECLNGSSPKCRAGIEVWNIGDVASICVAIKNVDMVILHEFSPGSNSRS